MTAFTNHFSFEFRTGIRNKTLLMMNYLFPLGFYLLMGFVMPEINPFFLETLIPAMVVFAILAATLLGVPDPLVNAREAGIFRSYKIRGTSHLDIEHTSPDNKPTSGDRDRHHYLQCTFTFRCTFAGELVRLCADLYCDDLRLCWNWHADWSSIVQHTVDSAMVPANLPPLDVAGRSDVTLQHVTGCGAEGGSVAAIHPGNERFQWAGHGESS